MSKRLLKSWEKTRDDVHSPAGVEDLRKNVKWGLIRKYCGIAETMFQWNLDNPLFEDMRIMSRDTVPEKFLMRNGYCVCFKHKGQLHMLPAVLDSGINIYGYPNGWHPICVGSKDTPFEQQDASIAEINNLQLDATNSVLIRNDIFDGSEYQFIESMVNLLVDNILTANQLQMLARMPMLFNVSEENLLDAKNYFLCIAQCKPAIFTNTMNGKESVIESTGVTIDNGILDLYRHWENILMEGIGCPGSIHTVKREYQSQDEVGSAEDKTTLRRHEKLRMREIACERINAMFDCDISVLSIIDSIIDDEKDEKTLPAGGEDDE